MHRNVGSSIGVIALTLLLNFVSAYNVLMISAVQTMSHRIALDAVAEALAERGNSVTVIMSNKELRSISGVTNKYLPIVEEQIEIMNNEFFKIIVNPQEHIWSFARSVLHLCEVAYHEPAYQELLSIPRAKSSTSKRDHIYDVMVLDAALNECSLPLAFHLDIPVVYISPTIANVGVKWNLNVPYPLFQFSKLFSTTQDNFGLQDRFVNLCQFLIIIIYRHGWFLPKLDEIVRKYIPDAPSIVDLEKNVAIFMTNTHVALHPSQPSMPYFMEVGCLNCREAQQLPKYLDDFLISSENKGFVYMSFGSFLKGEKMPLEFRNRIVAAFSKVPLKILWKLEIEIENISNNVKLVKWAPQQDILAHPNLKLFITCGGGLSTLEAAYHGSPILGIPLVFDQHMNIKQAVNRGFSEILDWQTFTSEDLKELIQRMISDKKYKDNALKVSKLLKDQPQPPLEKAAYWVEYVARHKGAPHLRSAADNLNVFQYFLLDVIGIALLLLFIGLLVMYALTKSLLSWITMRKIKTTNLKDLQKKTK